MCADQEIEIEYLQAKIRYLEERWAAWSYRKILFYLLSPIWGVLWVIVWAIEWIGDERR